jgi:hypothetical protein
LLELLLGCAVQCPDKERRVTEIMSLESGVKQDLMASIQQLMQNIDAARHEPVITSSFLSLGIAF